MSKARSFRLSKMSTRKRMIYALALGKSRGEIINELDVSSSYLRKVIWEMRHVDEILAARKESAKARRAARRLSVGVELDSPAPSTQGTSP
jgi:hypothetical protein